MTSKSPACKRRIRRSNAERKEKTNKNSVLILTTDSDFYQNISNRRPPGDKAPAYDKGKLPNMADMQ
jgi:hypothetical protein